jgi:hypothetical protein
MSPGASMTVQPRRWTNHVLVALVVTAALVAPTGALAKQPPAAANPAVITAWNAIAVTTIAGPAPTGAGKANAEAFIWFAFVQAAVYNAVEGITGRHELYDWNAKAPKGASPEAAAAVAAHRILSNYFGASPAIAANLDAALAASLGAIPDGVPKSQGMRYGLRAADRIISLRADDGRFAPITFDQPPAAGVWRPTPPAFAPMLDPWLGYVDPLVLDSLTQFDPGPPPPIGSARYRTEFNEVRDYGVKTGSLRTQAMTNDALFFFDTAIGPLQASIRDLVTRRGLDISDSARMFAAVDLGIADAIGTVWHAKHVYGWWRPITAIREADNDGDPQTAGVPGWEPFIVTPPYPEWPSGLNVVMATASAAVTRLNGDGRLDLTITSPGSGQTRHYEDPAVLQQSAVDARVWSGIHFRTADEASRTMGNEVANWTLDHYFAPTD